jgi:ribosomal protein S1
MRLNELKEKLRKYKKSDIIITNHAELQAFVREVDLEEVKENVINPTKLVYAKRQEAKFKEGEKYDCYFAYSKHFYHRYALSINEKIIIVTIIKINRDWQKAIG